MANVAVVDKCPSNVDYSKHFTFPYKLFHLCSTKKQKIIRADVDIDINVEDFDYIICIGSEATKYFNKTASVTDQSGLLLEDKFIPLINPMLVKLKPENEDFFKKSLSRIEALLQGERVTITGNYRGITDEDEAEQFLLDCLASDAEYVALDTETTSLYPREGHVLGISICYELKNAVYIDSSVFNETCVNLLQKIIYTKQVVFHNAKFDMKMLAYHFGLKFNPKRTHDTMVIHYVLDETQGSHGLKQLAAKFTDFGDYEMKLEEFKTEYCRAHKVKKEDFTYDLIPFEILSWYAAVDTAVTLELFNKFYPILIKNSKLLSVYDKILMPALFSFMQMEETGIPFSKSKLDFASKMLDAKIDYALKEMYSCEALKAVEQELGTIFNPNSVNHLRKLLFDQLKLPVIDITETNQASTNKDVLEQLAPMNSVVQHLSNYRKLVKVKNTFINKIAAGLNSDGRLRTFFNLTSTTSGRASSSGKFNAQQIIRDDPIVKGCIVAGDGYKLVSMD